MATKKVLALLGGASTFQRLRSHASGGRVGWYNAKLLPIVLPNWSIATLGSEVLHAGWVEAVTAL